jgi:hypothetical protein
MMNRVAPEAVSLRIFFVVLRFQIKSGKQRRRTRAVRTLTLVNVSSAHQRDSVDALHTRSPACPQIHDRPLRRTGATLALIPTMGAVHDGTCR